MTKNKSVKPIKFRGIYARLPESYYKRLRAEMLSNDIRSVTKWICDKLDEGRK